MIEKIHNKYCPIHLVNIGHWHSTAMPYCNCDNFTQTDGSFYNEHIKEEEMKQNIPTIKVFRCRGCHNNICVPIGYKEIPQCFCEKINNTGTIKELVNIF